jgi:hypothetical protein
VKPAGILEIKRQKYLKDKINELSTHSKSKNIRDLYRVIKEFKKGYQPRSNLVKDENGGLLADFHNILNRWKNYFSQLLNVCSVSDVRQVGIHTAQPSPFKIEISIAKLKKYNSPSIDQIPAS